MHVTEIRPDKFALGQQVAVQDDVNWLLAHKSGFVEVPCPACSSAESRFVYEKYGMENRVCLSCESQFISPRPTQKILAKFYQQSKNYEYWAKYIVPASREARRRDIFAPRAKLLEQAIRRHSIVGGDFVEVGAAHGLFCEEMAKLGHFDKIVAIEPTPLLAEECSRLGFNTFNAPWEDVVLERPASFVACFEVIEHLYDPAAFLSWCHSSLSAKGHVLLTCPNIEGFETMLLGRKSGAIDHEHLNLFNPKSISLLLRRCGFEVVECSTPGRLDVELVKRGLAAGDISHKDLGWFVSRIMQCDDREVDKCLQNLIMLSELSSNMMLLARKT